MTSTKKYKLYLGIFFLIIFSHGSINGQISSLAELSSGELKDFNVLIQSDLGVYGYMATLFIEKFSADSSTHEYVLLDKNLNIVSKSKFNAENSVLYYRGYLDKRDRVALFPVKYQVGINTHKLYSNGNYEADVLVIDLENEKIRTKEPPCYEANTITKCKLITKSERKAFWKEHHGKLKKGGFRVNSSIIELSNEGFLVFKFDEYKSENKNYTLQKFSEDKTNILWEHNLGGDVDNETIRPTILNINDDKIYLINKVSSKRRSKEVLVGIDMHTGEQTLEHELSIIPETSNYYSKFRKEYETEKFVRYLGRSATGYFQMAIDKEKNEVKYGQFNFEDLKHIYPKITKSGEVNRGYKLRYREAFMQHDHSIFILTEKHKVSADLLVGAVSKTEDFVVIHLDKDFNLIKAYELEKTRTRGYASDFQFSQEINKAGDAAFFYLDNRKEENSREHNWMLGINTIIDGVFTTTEIQVSKENSEILPFPAKKGYIGLIEFNLEDKTSSIRLEKLNY